MWTITQSRYTLVNEEVLAWIRTDNDEDLRLIYTYYQPSQTNKLKIVRGIPRICGTAWYYHKTVCLYQDEPGFSFTHTFHIPLPFAGSRIYFFYADDCQEPKAETTGPPMTINLIGTDPWLALQASDNHILSADQDWQEYADGSGLIAKQPTLANMTTGNTPDSHAITYINWYQQADSDVPKADANWLKRTDIAFLATFHAPSSASDRWAWLRIGEFDAGKDLSGPGIQFLFNRNGAKLYAQSKSATFQESSLVKSGDTLWDRPHWYRFVVNPGRGCSFFFDSDGLLIHINDYPNTYVTNGAVIQMGVWNASDPLDTALSVNKVMIKTDQE